MIFEDVCIMNNPVRPGKGMLVMVRTNADYPCYMAAGHDAIVVANPGSFYTEEIPAGRATRIENWMTVTDVGEHTMVVCAYAEETYETILEVKEVSFSVAERSYAVVDNIAWNNEAYGFWASGNIQVYDAIGTVGENPVLEIINWTWELLKDGVAFDVEQCTAFSTFSADGIYTLMVFYRPLTQPGTYNFTVRAHIYDGWGEVGTDTYTLLFEKSTGDMVVH